MLRSLRWCFLALLPACGAGSASHDPADEGPGPRNIVLILLDAARADRLSCYGYERTTTPRLDDLADRGQLFVNHFAHGTSTRTTLPSLIYSRYFAVPLFPRSTRIAFTEPSNLFRTTDSECVSIPRALSDAGYTTAAISAHTWLREGTPFAAEFDEMHELPKRIPYPEEYGYPRAEEVIDYSIAWLEEHRDQRSFLYIHLMDTHFPHLLEDDAAELFDEEFEPSRFTRNGVEDPKTPLTAQERRYLDALYDGSLRYTDRHLGRLIDYLDQRGELERTAIAVTADHGEHLMEVPGRIGHGGPWFDAVARIPLILSYPEGVDPGRSTMLTEAVDVLPTLAGLLGEPLPAGVRPDGIDLLAAVRGERPEKTVVWSKSGIRDARFKLLTTWPPPEDGRPGELYDLAADGTEAEVATDRPDVADELLAQLRERADEPYRRYLAATTDAQPDFPFAVASSDFALTARVRGVRDGLAVEDLVNMRTGNGWLRSKSWGRTWIFAGGPAEELTLEFPVPDGEYLVEVGLSGSCSLSVEGRTDPVELRASRADPRRPWTAERVELGSVTIRDETFRATIAPRTEDGPFFITQVGFRPIGASEEDEELARAALKRLETLGYVDGDSDEDPENEDPGDG